MIYTHACCAFQISSQFLFLSLSVSFYMCFIPPSVDHSKSPKTYSFHIIFPHCFAYESYGFICECYRMTNGIYLWLRNSVVVRIYDKIWHCWYSFLISQIQMVKLAKVERLSHRDREGGKNGCGGEYRKTELDKILRALIIPNPNSLDKWKRRRRDQDGRTGRLHKNNLARLQCSMFIVNTRNNIST